MSKIRQILEGSYISDDFIDKIKHDCAYYFHEVGYEKPLYRGVKKIIKEYDIIIPRKNRLPLDTPKEIHNELDKLFKKKFGWKVRSEGVFCSGWKMEVTNYGEPYIIIPIGKFKYVWSPEIRDLTVDLEYLDVLVHLNNKTNIIMSKSEYLPILENVVSSYKDKDLDDAIINDKEISIKCKEYYIINENYLDIKYSDLFK